MSKYTERIARKKFSKRFTPDHLLKGSLAKQVDDVRAKKAGTPNTYTSFDGKTFTRYDSMIDADRALVKAGKATREQWVSKYPSEKFDPGSGLLGGIANVLGDAAKLAVAPVSIAAGKNVKLTTGIGKVAGDALKLGVSPVTQAVTSVTGKKIDLGIQTKVGNAVGAIQETGSKALTSLVKGAGDVFTGGLATKAANIVRKDKYKEKAFKYNEMTPTTMKTGIKVIDKAAQVLPAASAALGGAVAGVIGGSKIADLLKGNDKSQGSMKETELQVGENVLDYQLPGPTQNGPLQAAFEFKPWHIAAILGAVLLLVVVSKYAKR